MAILAEACTVLRTFKNFKSFNNFIRECEELASVCTLNGEPIVILSVSLCPGSAETAM
jgi:hypothetical protein